MFGLVLDGSNKYNQVKAAQRTEKGRETWEIEISGIRYHSGGGGRSSRMGRDKALIVLNNRTLLVSTLEKMQVLFDEITS